MFISRAKREIAAKIHTNAILHDLKIDKATALAMCSLIYWCEGSKYYRDAIYFTNSDPTLVSIFLKLLRQAFVLDERKFRVCMHLHSYHNERDQLKFWSNTVNIPPSQFLKTFRKTEGGKNRKEGYMGCISLRYHDMNLKRVLLAATEELVNKMGP